MSDFRNIHHVPGHVIEITDAGLMIRKANERTVYGPIGWEYLHFKGGELEARKNREAKAVNKNVRKVVRNLLKT